MLEQPLPMSSALRASAQSLGFLMGYNVIDFVQKSDDVLKVVFSIFSMTLCDYQCLYLM